MGYSLQTVLQWTVPSINAWKTWTSTDQQSQKHSIGAEYYGGVLPTLGLQSNLSLKKKTELEFARHICNNSYTGQKKWAQIFKEKNIKISNNQAENAYGDNIKIQMTQRTQNRQGISKVEWMASLSDHPCLYSKIWNATERTGRNLKSVKTKWHAMYWYNSIEI